MPRSSGRGYVEPVAALAAVFVLGLGLTVYAGTLREARPANDRKVAETVLADLRSDAEELGVLDPGRLRHAQPPANWSANLTMATADGRWTRGETPPPRARRATARVAIRRGPGRVVPGRLEVAVWR
jgi:hypothetical protein